MSNEHDEQAPSGAEILHLAEVLNDVRNGSREAPTIVEPTPYDWIELEDIPPRPWIYGQDYCRGMITLTIAPGGLGKSTLCLTEAIAMASGRNLVAPCMDIKPLRAWYFNLEDPKQELQRKIAASCRHHGLKRHEIEGQLFIDSGLDTPLITATETEAGIVIEPVFQSIEKAVKALELDIIIVDPFVSSHSLGENDNSKIDRVAKRWAKLANDCNIAVSLVHHTRKNGGLGETDTESARGAKSLTDAARVVRVLNRMTKEEGERASLDLGEYRQYFRLNQDKANLAPAEHEHHWMRLVSVFPQNKEDDALVSVGVVERWDFPSAFEGVTVNHLYQFQKAIDGEFPGADVRASDWAGHDLARVCGLSPDDPADKSKLKRMIAGYEKSGAIKRTPQQRKNGGGKRPVFEVGEWSEIG
ncbi:MAG: AAA family ATPase [Pseudomonadota bacterium]